MTTELYRTLVSHRQEYSMSDRLVSPKMSEEEQVIEGSLRPRRLSEYIGQEKIKENLSILLEVLGVAINRSIIFSYMARQDWVKPRCATSSPSKWAFP